MCYPSSMTRIGSVGAVAWIVWVATVARADPPPVDERDGDLDAVSAAIGVSIGDGGAPGLRVEAAPTLGLVPPVHRTVDVDLRIPIGFGYTALDRDLGLIRLFGNAFSVDAAVMFDFDFAIIPEFHLFVAAGAGLGWTYLEIEQQFVGYQTSWAFSALLRAQAGARFQVTRGLWIDLHPLWITIGIAEQVGASFAFMAGIRWNEVAP